MDRMSWLWGKIGNGFSRLAKGIWARWRDLWWFHALRGWRFSRFTEYLLPLTIACLLAPSLHFAFKYFLVTEAWRYIGMSISEVAIFILVLVAQRFVSLHYFRGAFTNLICHTKDRHPVTKQFAARLLKLFLSREGCERLLESVDSLPRMMEEVEGNGRNLSFASYAMLLEEAAKMRPDELLATWDFGLFQIDEVFDGGGAVTAKYRTLFYTLTCLYVKIRNPRRKKRVFLFDDVNHEQRTKADSVRWGALIQLHKDWGFQSVEVCFRNDLKAAQEVIPNAILEDFVFYRINSIFMGTHEWVIGFDRDKHQAGLRHSREVLDATKSLYQKLLRESHGVSLA